MTIRGSIFACRQGVSFRMPLTSRTQLHDLIGGGGMSGSAATHWGLAARAHRGVRDRSPVTIRPDPHEALDGRNAQQVVQTGA
jgi:hypothetical protein